MPVASDFGGGGSTGGGTTTSVCRLSPSDELAVLNNYGSRISDIERFLSRLVYADVHADNLADLANNMGNLLNGTLMMPYSPNDSWSGVGGSVVVPDGFTGTYISGGVTTVWNDGVVTFQVTPHGIMTGSAPTDYLVVRPTSASLTLAPDLSNIIYTSGTAFGTDELASGRIVINEAGYYQVNVLMNAGWPGVGPSTWAYMTVGLSGFVAQAGESINIDEGTTGKNTTFQVSFGCPATAGSRLSVTFTGLTLIASVAPTYSYVSIAKMRST